MYRKTIGKIPLWQFDQLSAMDHLQHFVSGREGGVSQGEKNSLNLSYQVGDTPMNVDINRQRIAQAMHIPPGCLIFPKQTHSNNVEVVTKNTLDVQEQTDGLITDTPGICIAVLAADCVPVLLFDTKNRVVAAVHAGWRGTVGKLLTKTIEVMQEHFHSNPADVKVGIGPSISPQVYEIGEEVIEAIHDAFPGIVSQLLQPLEKKGKALFNLWEANKQQLIQLGVPVVNIEVAGICTYRNSDQFFSARASSIKGGRFGAGIMLTEE